LVKLLKLTNGPNIRIPEEFCSSDGSSDHEVTAAAAAMLMPVPTTKNPTTASSNETFDVAPNTKDKRLEKLPNGSEIRIPEESCSSDGSSNHEVPAGACTTPVPTNGVVSLPRPPPILKPKKKKTKKRKKRGAEGTLFNSKFAYDESDHEEHRNNFSLTFSTPNQTTLVVSSPNPTTGHVDVGLPEPIAVDAQQAQQAQQVVPTVHDSEWAAVDALMQLGFVTPAKSVSQNHENQQVRIEKVHREQLRFKNSSKKKRKILGPRIVDPDSGRMRFFHNSKPTFAPSKHPHPPPTRTSGISGL